MQREFDAAPVFVASKQPEPYKPGELCDNEFCYQQKNGPHAHVKESK
jgi:hypothetical protein